MDIQKLIDRAGELFDLFSGDGKPRTFILDPDTLGVREMAHGESADEGVLIDLDDWSNEEIEKVFFDSIDVAVWPDKDRHLVGPNSFEQAMHFNHRAMVQIDSTRTVTVLVRPESGWPIIPGGHIPAVLWNLMFQMYTSGIFQKAMEEVQKEMGTTLIFGDDMEPWQEAEQDEVHLNVTRRSAELMGATLYVGKPHRANTEAQS